MGDGGSKIRFATHELCNTEPTPILSGTSERPVIPFLTWLPTKSTLKCDIHFARINLLIPTRRTPDMPPLNSTILAKIEEIGFSMISRRWVLSGISSSISLDPVSLLTLFFDAPEKELTKQTGDVNYLTFFGLFVNPTTVWGEYGALYPGQGVRYYNPKMRLTSTVEIAQVNDYIVQLANGRRNEGLIVSLSERQLHAIYSIDWVVIRPVTLLCVTFVAAASRDYLALGGLLALFVGQAIGVIHTLKDGVRKKVSNPYVPSHNVFFLANNVTVIVKSDKDLFVKACSSLNSKKLEKPVLSEILSTLIFMAGVLLLGIAGLNSKIAYLVGHALQAIALALYSKQWRGNQQIVNSVTWTNETPYSPSESEMRQTAVANTPPTLPVTSAVLPTTQGTTVMSHPANERPTEGTSAGPIKGKAKRLYQRRDAYVWVVRETFGMHPDVTWLSEFQLADPTCLEWVQRKLGHTYEIPADV